MVSLRSAITSQSTRGSEDVVPVRVIVTANQEAFTYRSHAIMPGAMSIEGVKVKYVSLGKHVDTDVGDVLSAPIILKGGMLVSLAIEAG